MERNQKFILYLVMVISTLLLFQNCGPQMLSNMDVPSQVEPLADKPVIPDCQFNRTNMFVGDSVIAYQTSTVPTGNTCVSESRVCRGGRLSGSFQYSTCLPGVPAACLQNGTTIPHGRSIKFYQTNSVQFGAACTSEDRTCNNGSLSGSFTFSECNVQQPGECVVSGLRFAHRTQKLFFKNLTVPYGQNCQSEYRQCHNGSVVNGSFTELTCGIDFPKNCVHGDQTIGHELSKSFFKSDTLPFGQTCQQKSLSCFNGVITGDTTYAASTCFVQSAADCALYDGTPVAHLGSIIAYQYENVAFGDDCNKYSKVLKCNNKVLPADSTTYKYSKCSASITKDCPLPDGGRLAHGESATLKKYKYVLENESCDASWNTESVTCSNGTLSGSGRYRACQPLAPQILTAAGGNGGSLYENRCQAPGARAVGLYGGSGINLDRIGVVCSTAPNTGVSGGYTGTTFSASCPTGKYLAGISGTSSTNYYTGSGNIKAVRLFCANADGSGGEWTQNQGSGSTYTYYQVCPPGSVVIGLKGRSGSLVDQIQVMCGKMMEPANINCAGTWFNHGCSNTFRGVQHGNRAQRFLQTQPAGGTGTACSVQDGQFQEDEDGCGSDGGIER